MSSSGIVLCFLARGTTVAMEDVGGRDAAASFQEEVRMQKCDRGRGFEEGSEKGFEEERCALQAYSVLGDSVGHKRRGVPGC